MASTERQVVKLLAEEIAHAINKKSGGNALNASSALTAKTAQSLSGTINASQIIGNMNASQIAGLNGAIAGVLIGLPSSTDPDSIEIKAVISDLAALEVKNATIDTAQIENLYASYGEFIRLVAEEGEFDEVYANIAEIGLANIDTAKIKWGQMETVDSDIILSGEGVVGSLTIGYLNVTDANIVSLSVGKLAIKDENGNLVRIVVDSEGDVTSEAIDGKFIGDNTMSGTKIIEHSITADQIAAGTITAEEIAALAIKARNIDVGDLFAAEGFISQLQTNIISSDLSQNTSVIKLADDRIAMIVSGEEEGQEGTSFVLTDKMIRAISKQFKVEADTIDLSANKTISISASQIKDYHIGPLAPSEPFDGMLWLDTDAIPNIWKQYDAENDTWLLAECSFVDSMLEGAVAKVFNAEFDIDGTNGTIKSMVESIEANESGLSDVKQAVELITPEHIITTVTNSESFSAIKQEADKIQFVIGDGTDNTQVIFTDNAVEAMSKQIKITADMIEITADHVNAVMKDVILDVTQLQAVMDQINLTADQVEAVMGNVALDISQLEAAFEKAKITGDLFEIIAGNISLETNNSFQLLLGNVETVTNVVEESKIDYSPDPPNTNVEGKLWIDSDEDTPTLRKWNGEVWEIVNDTDEIKRAQTSLKEQQDSTYYAIQQLQLKIYSDDTDNKLHITREGSSSEMTLDDDSLDVNINGVPYSVFGAGYVQFGNVKMFRPAKAGGMAFIVE